MSEDRSAELTQLLYREAALLDDGRFDEWAELLAEDLVYRMPTRPQLLGRTGYRGADLWYIDDDRSTILSRIAKIATGLSQTENPPSRTVRLVSNVLVDATEGDEYPVRSALLIYRHRKETDVELLAAHRHDRWRRTADGWRLAVREIVLAANVLPTSNLALFY